MKPILCRYDEHTWHYTVNGVSLKSGTYFRTSGHRWCSGCNLRQCLDVFEEFNFPIIAKLLIMIKRRWSLKLLERMGKFYRWDWINQ